MKTNIGTMGDGMPANAVGGIITTAKENVKVTYSAYKKKRDGSKDKRTINAGEIVEADGVAMEFKSKRNWWPWRYSKKAIGKDWKAYTTNRDSGMVMELKANRSKTIYCTSVDGFLVSKDDYGTWRVRPPLGIFLDEKEEAVFNYALKLTALGVSGEHIGCVMKEGGFEIKTLRLLRIEVLGMMAGKILNLVKKQEDK